MRRAIFLLGAILLSLRGFAQEIGGIGGVVVSAWDGATLSGVIITIRGTTLATQTDLSGRYQINNAPIGDQVVRFSKPGFASAVVTDVRVLPGQTTTVNGHLRPEFYEMEEYEVTAEEFTEQSEKIIFERQQASGLVEAIGSDMFKNLAISDAAGALSKVTGVSIADGKYAVIRGLADRYTFTTLNGMELPSADPDRKAFQLDLMPAKFIQKIDVRKTFTPDISGGFAGGSIDIVTKSFPEDFTFELRASTAYNTQSSLRDDFPTSNQGGKDWLAFDDGTRAMPPELEASNPSGSQPFPPELKASFKETQFAPVESDAFLDRGMELLFGDTETVFGKRLGYLAGLNYKNESKFYDDAFVRSYEAGGTVEFANKNVREGIIESQWGSLVNLNLEMSENHNFKFNFLKVQAAEDYAGRAVGSHGDLTSPEDGTYMDLSVLNWTERSLTYFQLGGDHLFPELNDLEFDWGAATSTTTQEDPDFRAFQFRADPVNNSYNPNLTAAQPSRPSRYWRELEEVNKSLRGDFTIPVPSYNSQENFLKTGAALNISERDYFQRGISVTGRPGHPFATIGDPNIWMAETNLSFINVANFPVNLTYTGEQEIVAAYLMADWAALEKLRLIGGARLETTRITVDSFNLTQNRPLPIGNLKQDDWLPSLTAKYQIRANLDIQAAWSQTVIRPTYREIAPVAIYDVFKGRAVQGNPGLQMAASQNLDLRASWYPRPGELISASVFAKQIEKPIEMSAITRDYSQIGFVNSEDAELFGVEAEAQFKLDRLWQPLEEFSLGFNAAYIKSDVPLTETERLNRAGFGETSTSRSLYDQPEYILNANLTWENANLGTTVTLSGGMVGESLVLVGLAKPDEFVQPAPDLNLFVRQRFGKNWDVRFTAKNLLNPRYEVTQTWPAVGEVVLESYTKGITFGLSVGCEF